MQPLCRIPVLHIIKNSSEARSGASENTSGAVVGVDHWSSPKPQDAPREAVVGLASSSGYRTWSTEHGGGYEQKPPPGECRLNVWHARSLPLCLRRLDPLPAVVGDHRT